MTVSLSMARWTQKPNLMQKSTSLQSVYEHARPALDMSYSKDNLMQGIETPTRQVRTRIFFTSESHVHAMRNLFRFGTTWDGRPILNSAAREILSATTELDFLTHFVIKVFERPGDPERPFRVEVHFSAGSNESPMDYDSVPAPLSSPALVPTSPQSVRHHPPAQHFPPLLCNPLALSGPAPSIGHPR